MGAGAENGGNQLQRPPQSTFRMVPLYHNSWMEAKPIKFLTIFMGY
jgi:hypothetical protein